MTHKQYRPPPLLTSCILPMAFSEIRHRPPQAPHLPPGFPAPGVQQWQTPNEQSFPTISFHWVSIYRSTPQNQQFRLIYG